MSAVDQQIVVKVRTLGNPKAALYGMRIHDNIASKWYNVAPEGEQSYCTPGAAAGHIVFGVVNAGESDGTIYVKAEVYENGVLKTVIIADPRYIPVKGMQVYENDFDMPTHDLNITITLGH